MTEPTVQDEVAALRRRLEATNALLAEERAAHAAEPSEREEVVALRDELDRARAQVAAAQREVRKIRASGTYRAGLRLKQAAQPALRARRVARTVPARARRALAAARKKAGR